MSGLIALTLALALGVALLLWLRRTRRRVPLGTQYSSEVRGGLAHIDRAAEELLAGREITDSVLEECGEAFSQFYRYLSRVNRTADNNRFSAGDRAVFYLYGVKLAALQHPDHNAWPIMASLREAVVQSPPSELDSPQASWVHLAFVTPALLARDVGLAERLYRQLPRVLARIAVQWVAETTVGYKDFNHIPSSQRLLQAIGAPAPSIPHASDDPLSRDQRWAISVAVHPSYATDSRASLSDPLPAAVCRLALERWWDITDAESAVSTLEWLLDGGHRERLMEDLELLTTDELEPAKRAFLLENEAELREYGIVAWDLCRLVNVARTAHKAGYIDEPTAWHFVLSAARELRDTYPSWNDMGDDYILGNRYFSADHRPESTHRASVEWLQRAPSSPWRIIDWNDEP